MSSTMAFPVTFRPELKVTGASSLNGGGTVKTPADYVNTSDIVPASWVWKLIRRYGLAGGINTAVDVSDAYPSRDLNDVDATGFYTCSSNVANSPKGEQAQNYTGLLIHVHRRFSAGPVAWQMSVQQTTPNVIFYRVKNGSEWSEWFKIAQDNNVVHLDGNELVTGKKSIKNDLGLVCYVSKGDKSNVSHRQIQWWDSDIEERLGVITLRTGTDGSTRLEFFSYENVSGSENNAHAFLEYKANGNRAFFVPRPLAEASSDEAVTAAWTRSKFLALDGSTSMAANLKLGPHAPVIESTQTVDSNDSIPDVSRFNGHSVYAENGDRIAYIQLASRNDGRREYNMYVRNPYVDGEVFHGLKWGFAADASFYAQLTQSPVTESNDNSIATTKWVRDLLLSAVPTGTILPFAGKTVPSGFLSCNKANVSRTTYAKLFSIIGTTYGSGDGSTTFTLPDYRNRFVMGANTASEVGTYLESGAPNITGLHSGIEQSGTVTEGCFYLNSVTGVGSGDSDYDNPQICFDASRSSSVYGRSEEIQPPAGKALWIIKL